MADNQWIKQVAAAALVQFDEAMQILALVGGKRQGKEYLPLNPRRADRAPGSFSINTDSGAWMDGATGDKGKDLVSLAAYVWHVKQTEAGRQLAAHFGIAVPDAQRSATRNQNCGGNGSASAAPKKSLVAAESSGDVCVIPVPDDAPPPPAAHKRHGRPAKRWAYRDAAGRVCFYHDRYEPKGERKQFAPLTLWRSAGGKLGWQFKAAPVPRSIMNADQLAQRADALVVIVEGEKAADAAALLWPDAVAVCWQGGAQAVERADWRPLAGRDVVLWPDADDPGAACMDKLARVLHGLGVDRVRRLDLAQLAKVASIDAAGAAILTAGEPLAEGDDAADLAARGWTAAHFNQAREAAGFLVEIPATMAAPQSSLAQGDRNPERGSGRENAACILASRRFSVEPGGVYFIEPEKAPRWVCPLLEVVALVRDPHGEGWGKLVRFKDPDGLDKRRIIPDAMLSGDGTELERTLRGAGLKVAPSGKALLRQYLIESSPEARARVTDRTGWHECSDGGAAFVMPSQAFGTGSEEWLFQTDALGSHAFAARGSLAGWREEVSALCVGNTRLAFSVCMAFASPLLRVTGAESGGFHLRSGSSDGKTTCLHVGASVCGGSDYMQRWRATDNAFEGVALRHCDAPLFLDEIAQVEPRVAGETAYMLANGEGKNRAGKDGGIRAKSRWRLLFLSAGEVGLAQHMGEAGKQAKAGQELRLAEIPADAGAGLGVFEDLHGAANGAEFAKALDRAINRHYGTAWLAFVQRLVIEREAIADELRAVFKSFETRFLTDAAAGQARRVADRFALVGAAGELATKWGITGWQPGEAMKAAGAMFNAWLSNRGGEGRHEEREAMAAVREFLQRYAESAFSDWNRPGVDTDKHASVRSDRAGYRRYRDDGEDAELEFYIFNEVWRTRVCKGLDPAFVGRIMVERGYVKKGEREWVSKVRTPEGPHRVIHVLPHFLEAEA